MSLEPEEDSPMADPVSCAALLFKVLVGAGGAAATAKAISSSSTKRDDETNRTYGPPADWKKYPIDGYYY
jgi:hypothetical protein